MLKLPSSIVSSTRQVAAVLKTFSTAPSASGFFAALAAVRRDSGPSPAYASPMLAESAPTASQEANVKGPIDQGPVVGVKGMGGVLGASPVGANQPSLESVKPPDGAIFDVITARARFPILSGQKADAVDVKLSSHLDPRAVEIRRTVDGDVTLQPAPFLSMTPLFLVHASGVTPVIATSERWSVPDAGNPARTNVSGRQVPTVLETVVLVRDLPVTTPAPTSLFLDNLTHRRVMHSGLESSNGADFTNLPEIKLRAGAPGSVTNSVADTFVELSPVIAAGGSSQVAPAPTTLVADAVALDATPPTVVSGIGLPVAAMVPGSRPGVVAADASPMLTRPASPPIQETTVKGFIDLSPIVNTKSIGGVPGANSVEAPQPAIDGVQSPVGAIVGRKAARAWSLVQPGPKTNPVADQPLGHLDRWSVATPMPILSPLDIITVVRLVNSGSGTSISGASDGAPEIRLHVGAPGSAALKAAGPLVEPGPAIAVDGSPQVAPPLVTLMSDAEASVATSIINAPGIQLLVAATVPGLQPSVALSAQSMVTAISSASTIAVGPGTAGVPVGLPPSASPKVVRTGQTSQFGLIQADAADPGVNGWIRPKAFGPVGANTTLNSPAPRDFSIDSVQADNSVSLVVGAGSVLGKPDASIVGSPPDIPDGSRTNFAAVASQVPDTRFGPVEDMQDSSVRTASGQSGQVEASSRSEASPHGDYHQQESGLAPLGTTFATDVSAPNRPSSVYVGTSSALTEQVVAAVSAMAQSRSLNGKMSVSVAPAELGRINITVERELNGTTTIHVQAERLATLDMLRTDQVDLMRALDQSGHDRNSHSLIFSWDGDGGSSGWGHPAWGSQGGQSSGYLNAASGQIAYPETLPSLAFQAAARGGVDVTA